MKRIVIIVIALAIPVAGCGKGISGKVDQRQYCHDNGWIYEPATDTCKVK